MLKVGGEIDSFCTKCEMNLAHTIIAMVDGRPVKVECNTCHGVHRFRGHASTGRSTAPRTASVRGGTPSETSSARRVSFEEALRSKDLASAQRYSPKATYQVDQVIEHPTFGLGWVSAIRDAGKVEVTFRNDVKILVQGKS